MTLRERVADMMDDVPHPFLFIREELEERGWTLEDLAARMTRDDESYGLNLLALQMYEVACDTNGSMHKGLRIGDRTARDLARAFGTSPTFFTNLEEAWLKSIGGEP